MSQGNPTFTERFLFSFANPGLVDNTTLATPWIYAGNLINAIGIVQVGATDVTVDAKWQSATDSSGTDPQTVTGAEITQLAATGDNSQAAIELEIGKLATTRTYIRMLATAADGTNGANLSMIVIASPRHLPPTQPTSLVEVVKISG